MKLEQLGGAISHWLGYQDKIGRSFMMNEDAIKYPLSDYLVNHGGHDLKSIELQRPHPNFSTRLIDVAIIDSGVSSIKNAFELKLAKSATRQAKEQQRIFNDIIRMHITNKSSSDKCFFIITGKSTHFERDFYNFEINGLKFYHKWFSFKKGATNTFNVKTESEKKYKDIYEEFVSKYENNYNAGQLDLPNTITTKCEFVTPFKKQLVPYMTAIWSIS